MASRREVEAAWLAQATSGGRDLEAVIRSAKMTESIARDAVKKAERGHVRSALDKVGDAQQQMASGQPNFKGAGLMEGCFRDEDGVDRVGVGRRSACRLTTRRDLPPPLRAQARTARPTGVSTVAALSLRRVSPARGAPASPC